MTIWRMRFECWIHTATNTHSGCVILIVFSLQHCMHESALVSRYIACVVVCLAMPFLQTVWHRMLRRLVIGKAVKRSGRGWFYVQFFFIRGEESRENSPQDRDLNPELPESEIRSQFSVSLL